MSSFPDAAEDRLLRGLTPPPLPAGFADRVMAALPAGEAPRPALRDRRRPWKRGRVAVIGAVAAGLLSVGAAASGILGGRIQKLPVIASIAEVVTTAPVAAPKAPHKEMARAKPRPAPVELVKPAVLTPRELQREVVAQHIATRIERREARRAQFGQQPVDFRARRIARERLRALPPAERRALVERVREIRAERATTSDATQMPLPTLTERGARWRQMRDQLTPEQRERLLEWRQRRRATRGNSAPVEPEPIE